MGNESNPMGLHLPGGRAGPRPRGRLIGRQAGPCLSRPDTDHQFASSELHWGPQLSKESEALPAGETMEAAPPVVVVIIRAQAEKCTTLLSPTVSLFHTWSRGPLSGYPPSNGRRFGAPHHRQVCSPLEEPNCLAP